jgi:hypothetical protein
MLLLFLATEIALGLTIIYNNNQMITIFADILLIKGVYVGLYEAWLLYVSLIAFSD